MRRRGCVVIEGGEERLSVSFEGACYGKVK